MYVGLLSVFALQALVPIAYVLLLALGPQGAGQTGWGHVENFAAAWDQGSTPVPAGDAIRAANGGVKHAPVAS